MKNASIALNHFFFINLMCIYKQGKSFLWIPEEIMNKIFMYNSQDL